MSLGLASRPLSRRYRGGLPASLDPSPSWLDRRTVRKYTRPAVEAGFSPGGPPVAEQVWAARAREWFPQLIDTRLRQSSWPAITAQHERISVWLTAGVSVATIHQRLRDEHGLSVSESSLRRYVEGNLAAEATRASVTVLREDPPPGQEAQVDYGLLGRWYDPAATRWRRVWAFVMVLATSRYMFVRPVLVMDQRAWTECHVAAFEFFGGSPERIVLDNLTTGVTKADLYDPKLNRAKTVGDLILRAARVLVHQDLCHVHPLETPPRHRPPLRHRTCGERDHQQRGRSPRRAGVPQGNSVTAGWGNYLTGSALRRGNYVTDDRSG